MIRAVDFRANPVYQEKSLTEKPISEWRSSLRYLEDHGSTYYWANMGRKVLDRITTVCGAPPATDGLSAVLEPFSKVVDVASLALFADAYLQNPQNEVKQTLELAESSVGFATWVAEIETLAISSRIIFSLSSMGLALSFILPMLDLFMLLREESLDYKELSQKTFKVGLALLSIYLFITALTLSDSLSFMLTGAKVFLTII